MPRVRHGIRRVRPRSDRAGPEQETVTRRLLNLLTLLSLLLCGAVCVLWVRSHWAAEGLAVLTGPQRSPDRRALAPGVQVISRGGYLAVRQARQLEMDTLYWKPLGEV